MLLALPFKSQILASIRLKADGSVSTKRKILGKLRKYCDTEVAALVTGLSGPFLGAVFDSGAVPRRPGLAKLTGSLLGRRTESCQSLGFTV